MLYSCCRYPLKVVTQKPSILKSLKNVSIRNPREIAFGLHSYSVLYISRRRVCILCIIPSYTATRRFMSMEKKIPYRISPENCMYHCLPHVRFIFTDKTYCYSRVLDEHGVLRSRTFLFFCHFFKRLAHQPVRRYIM